MKEAQLSEIIDTISNRASQNDFQLGVLESLSQNDLERVLEVLKETPKEIRSTPLKSDDPFYLRLEMRTLFLLGKRDLALAIAKKILTKKFMKKWGATNNGEDFIVEAFQVFNRTDNFSLVKKHFESYKDRSCPVISELLRVEFYVAHIEDDLEYAKSGLYKITNTSTHFKSSFHNQYRLTELRANTYFQLARIYYAQKNYNQALNNYEEAKESFLTLGMVYFATFTYHNIVWLQFYQRNWESFNREYQACFKLASQFSFNYILAGLHHMKSEYFKMDLKYLSSLREADLSLVNLPKTGSIAQRFDTLLFKADIFLAIGDYRSTRKILKEISSLGFNSKKYLMKFERWSTYLKFLTQKPEATSDQKEILNAHPAYFIRTYQINQSPGFEEGFIRQSLNNTILEGNEFLLFQKEITLLKTLHRKDEKCALSLLEEMKSYAKSSEIFLIQDFTIELLESLLKSKLKSKSYYLKLMKKVSNIEAYKDVLRPIINCLYDRNLILSEQQGWQEASSFQKNRWLKWFSRFVTIDKQFDTIASGASEIFIHYHEPRSVILVKGKEIKAIKNRLQLKRLLKLFLLNSNKDLKKKEIVEFVWEEKYHPRIHDSRIYTAINRLRELLGIPDLILRSNQKYFYNSKYEFKLTINKFEDHQLVNQVQNQIIESLQSYHRNKQEWVGRSELKPLVKTSDATLKRELKKLVEANILVRKGSSRNTSYSVVSVI